MRSPELRRDPQSTLDTDVPIDPAVVRAVAGRKHGVLAASIGRVGARLASSAMLGVLFLMVASAMPVTAFGQLVLAYTLGMTVGLLAGMGAPARALRSNALDRDPTAASEKLFLLHTATVTVAYLFAMAVLVAMHAPEMFMVGATFGYSDTVQNYAQSHLAGRNRHGLASALGVVARLIPLAAVGASIVVSGTVSAGLLTAAFAVVALIGVAAPLLTTTVRGLWTRARSVVTTRPFEGASGYWALAASGTLSQLQIPALAVFASGTAVGWFGLATRVTGPLTLLAAAMSTVLVPELAKHLGDSNRFSRLYRRYIGVSVAYCVLVVVAAIPGAWVLVHVVGEQYWPAQSMVAGMMVAAGLSSVSQAMTAKPLAHGQPYRITAAIVAGGGLTLVLLVVAGWSGETSMVWVAPVAGQLVVLVVLVWIARWSPKSVRVQDIRSQRIQTKEIPAQGSRRWLRRSDAFVLAGTCALAVVVTCAALVARTPAADTPTSTTAAAAARAASADLSTSSVKILVIGDSVSEGTPFGGRGDRNWVRIVQGGLAGEDLNRCPIMLRVSARGGSGYSVHGLRHTIYRSEVARLMTPQISGLVIVGSGNDVNTPPNQYRAAVRATVEQARKVVPSLPVVLVAPSWIKSNRMSRGFAAQVDALRAEASALPDVRFIDPNSEGWFRGMDRRVILGGDRRHPTDAGHRVLAERMLPVFSVLGKSGRCTS